MAVCAAVLLLGTGCEKTRKVEFVATNPVLSWTDLDLPATTALDDGYAVLVKEQTRGLFPAAVAVARVKAAYRSDGTAGTLLEMKAEPESELLPWNSVLDDQRLVSGVFPIKPLALQGEEATVAHILSTARAMKAPICLVYGTASLGPHEAELRGAIFDTANHRPLAVMHAWAEVSENDTTLADLPAPPAKDPEYFSAAKDPRYQDAPGAAVYKFETLVRNCMIALRKNDASLENQPTEGWIPETPPNAMIVPVPRRPPLRP